MTKVLETIARISGEMQGLAQTINVNHQVSFVQSREYLELRTAILDALRPHPEAMKDVAAAVAKLERKAEPAQAALTAPIIDVTPK